MKTNSYNNCNQSKKVNAVIKTIHPSTKYYDNQKIKIEKPDNLVFSTENLLACAKIATQKDLAKVYAPSNNGIKHMHQSK